MVGMNHRTCCRASDVGVLFSRLLPRPKQVCSDSICALRNINGPLSPFWSVSCFALYSLSVCVLGTTAAKGVWRARRRFLSSQLFVDPFLPLSFRPYFLHKCHHKLPGMAPPFFFPFPPSPARNERGLDQHEIALDRCPLQEQTRSHWTVLPRAM